MSTKKSNKQLHADSMFYVTVAVEISWTPRGAGRAGVAWVSRLAIDAIDAALTRRP